MSWFVSQILVAFSEIPDRPNFMASTRKMCKVCNMHFALKLLVQYKFEPPMHAHLLHASSASAVSVVCLFSGLMSLHFYALKTLWNKGKYKCAHHIICCVSHRNHQHQQCFNIDVDIVISNRVYLCVWVWHTVHVHPGAWPKRLLTRKIWLTVTRK